MAKETKNTIVIRLKKGRISLNPNQRACLKGLGLKKRHQEMTLENTPAVRGMIKKVIQFVEILADN
ncbi:MAG: 50S ribosomal protein L30 [Proteobacteria bacterium]|nr:50S ribosomal protein L30 [Pseudomonadota bacterium]